MLQQCYLESDHTTMFYAAKALMTLQALYGVIPNLYGKGECAAVCLCAFYHSKLNQVFFVFFKL